MKSNGVSEGNVGRLLFKIRNDKNAINFLTERIKDHLIQSLYKKQYNRKWLTGPPTWSDNDALTLDTIIRLSLSKPDLLNALPLPVFNTAKGGLFQVYIIEHLDATYFMLAWHHVLLDARGAESFARHICGETIFNKEDFFLAHKSKKIVESLNDAKDTKSFLLTDKGMGVNSLANKKTAKKLQAKYKTIVFDKEETESIQKTASKNVRLAKSPFYLACCATVVKDIIREREEELVSLLIPVPQDQRLRGSVKPIFGNSISYLFFRLKPNDFESLKSTSKSIADQMMHQIRKKIPTKYVSMLNIFSRTPLWFNNWIMSGPTKGVFASFFFSDTGSSLSDLNENAEIIIEDIFHLPPPNTYPGLTLVFSILAARLKICICYTDNVLDKNELSYFEENMRLLLIGDGD